MFHTAKLFILAALLSAGLVVSKASAAEALTEYASLNYTEIQHSTYSRIPVQAPEWTNHESGDPGMSILSVQEKTKDIKAERSELKQLSLPTSRYSK